MSSAKRLTAALATFGLVLMTLTGAAAYGDTKSSMQADASAETGAASQYELVNWGTNTCLDDSAAGVRAIACNDTTYQRWYVVGTKYTGPQLGTASKYKNRFTGECLDYFAGQVTTKPCNDTNWQYWSLRHLPSDGYALVNVASGLCLDHSKYGLRAIRCNGGVYQTWSLL